MGFGEEKVGEEVVSSPLEPLESILENDICQISCLYCRLKLINVLILQFRIASLNYCAF